MYTHTPRTRVQIVANLERAPTAACAHTRTEEELLELKEEFATRLGAADAAVQALKVLPCMGRWG